MVGDLAGYHWDLGSIPRSTQNSHNIFHNVILCRPLSSVPPCSSLIQTPCVYVHQSNGYEVLTMMFPSQPTCRQFQKSNVALWLNGLQIAFLTSIWAQHPPGFITSYCFYFLSFLLIIIIISI